MSFTTIGCNHTKFWTVDTGVNTRMKSPLGVKNSRYGKNNRMPRKTFCGAYMDGGTRLLSGGSNGVVYLWDTNDKKYLDFIQGIALCINSKNAKTRLSALTQLFSNDSETAYLIILNQKHYLILFNRFDYTIRVRVYILSCQVVLLQKR